MESTRACSRRRRARPSSSARSLRARAARDGPRLRKGRGAVIMPRLLSGGTRRMRPDRRILSIASFDAESRSAMVGTRRAARSGTSVESVESIESASAGDGGAGAANGSNATRGTIHPPVRSGNGRARRDTASEVMAGEGGGGTGAVAARVTGAAVAPVSRGGALARDGLDVRADSRARGCADAGARGTCAVRGSTSTTRSVVGSLMGEDGAIPGSTGCSETSTLANAPQVTVVAVRSGHQVVRRARSDSRRDDPSEITRVGPGAAG